MRRTDRQTDGRTKATLIASFPAVGGIITVALQINSVYYATNIIATERL